MPKFWDRIAAEYKAGSAHLFLLHFNVHDLAHDEVYGYLPMLYYLMEQLNVAGCDLVIGYSPSQGVVWPYINQWKSVQKMLGLLPHEEEWEGGTVEIPPMGEFRPDGKFIADRMGFTRIRATVGQISAESDQILVTTDQIHRLEISPKRLEIESGKMFRFTLTAYDRSGREIGVQHARWEVIGEIGSMTRDGVFIATKAGKGRIRAHVIGPEKRAESEEITVVPGKLTQLKIDQSTRRIPPGEPHAFNLVGEDAHGNVVEVQDAEWEVIREERAQPRRTPINSKLIVGKIHEDPFITSKLPPGKELREKLDALLHQDGVKAGVVINFMEKIVPNAELTTLQRNTMSIKGKDLSIDTGHDPLMFLETFQHWAMDLDMRLKKHIVLLMTQNLSEVHPGLTKNPDIPVIEVPLPNYDERLKFIEHLMNLPIKGKPDNRAQFTSRLTLAPDLTKEQLARDTAGLNLFGIHDGALRAEEVQQPISRELVETYRRESVDILSRGILTVGGTSSHLDSAIGLDHVINVIRDVVDAMNEGDLRRVPHGMLFLGLPGTGKVMAAKLLAGHGNMPFVQLKNAREGIGIEYAAPGVEERIYERNLTFAINFIRALTPAVVFIEEADQGTLRADTTPERADSMLPVELLNTIRDPSLHGQVIWIGASSRPDLLDPIFRRSGLFDYKLIFLPPSEAERAQLLEVICKGYGIDGQRIDFGQIAADAYTNGLSARELGVIVQRSYNIAKRNNRPTMTEADLIEAATDFVPDYSPEMNLFIGLLALREANSLSMIPTNLPPEYQEFIKNNRINKTKINKLLNKLGKQLGLTV